MAVIRFIELYNDADVQKIPVKNGQLLYSRDLKKSYVDSDNMRNVIDIVKAFNTITDIISPDATHLYYTIDNDKLYKYEVNEFIEVTDTIEIFELWSDHEDMLSGYLSYDERPFLPITSTDLVFSGDGSTLTDILANHSFEIEHALNPYSRTIPVTEDNQTVFPVPIPYRAFFSEGHQIDIFINGVKIVENEDYILDKPNCTITLNNPVPLNTQIDCIIYYMRSVQDIYQETIIVSDKTVLDYNVNISFIPNTGMTSLYVNGIKQPKTAYIETGTNSFRLRGNLPKGTILMFECGKLLRME